jgi:voltage-gated potassium channel
MKGGRMGEAREAESRRLLRERRRLLVQLENALEIPMIILGFVWLGLLIMELSVGLNRPLQITVTAIWVLFIIDFIVKLVIAPERRQFLGRNWLTIIALVVPALRIFRIAGTLRVLRLSRATRGFRLVRITGSMNRGLRTLRRTMRRRSFGYVLTATVMVVIVGSLGMQAFEGATVEAFSTWGSSLWWTMMLVITLPTGNWPVTPEGRILGFVLALYGFTIFGYVTAVLASWFVGKDEEESERLLRRSIVSLRKEISSLRSELEQRDLAG